MMSQYTVFQAIFMSFYSGKLYRDVGQFWGGKAFLYLFVLLAMLWIVPSIHMQKSINTGYTKLSAEIVKQIPVITVTNGKVSTPENKPYLISDPAEDKNQNKIFAIIDMTGQYTSLANTGADVLVTPTEVFLKHSATETRTYQIPSNLNSVYNPLTINKTIGQYIGYIWILIYFCMLMLSFMYRIFQAMVYAIIGKLYSAVSGAKVNYGTILIINMVAITPAMTLATITDIFSWSLPHETLICFTLSMFYMIYGIRANKT